ncbi:MAG: dihydroorotate dehydrogenase-like protein [Proteiniphilum sp.]|jgi:dihydroorotate dehydrogenase (fumarate)|nr:dihydroorotate dehydrogenase-like protein [Proteiniphilum sp.]NCB24329.1 dihydroorotate dehydrogenase-like protein [Bacteroidia bacterium]MDD2937385.1 dihydroorotate dehydrogenase-like protein [Proteiniphilum sp.]MDD3076649.1 dihydroorotate dehydrogenase-like protein [Proteiniphilum sp.]MDD3779640.1 dihydroorotate dehydrogenase-like protein [Proteiniphilum sp.]
MINLETTFAGLKLKNPLIAGSSGLTNSIQKIQELEEAGIGAIVLKSLFEEQIENHSEKLSQLSDYPEAADYINTYIEMNHVEKYLDLIRTAKETCSVPIVASINCYKSARWVDFAKTIQQAGADALELNLFVLNAGEFNDSYLEDTYVNVVRELKKTLRIPLVIKMAKNISNLPGLVGKLKALGADGVVLFNRFYQLDIDIKKLEITAGPVFSNQADFSDTLRWTAIVSGRVPDFDIACSYGVHNWEDVIKGILAGAGGIQLCSVLYEQGPEVIGEILTLMEEWMQQNNYERLEAFKGKLNYANISSPYLYERVQFMKYFSNYK